MVRCTKRTAVDDSPTAAEQSGDAVDLRDVERLGARHRGQDRAQTLREHRLSATRRSDEQQIVSAGRRDLEGSLRGDLPADVGEVALGARLDVRTGTRRSRAPLAAVAANDGDRIDQRVDGVELEMLDEERLVR